MIRFSADFLERLRERIVLTELIGQKVKLVRAGRLVKALCPFHSEKTPSFYIYDDQGNYHCYGCGVHGDAISYVQETQGVSFQEAVEQLASQAGLPLPQHTPISPEQQSEKAELLAILEAACGFFQSHLKGAARTYLEDRGYAEETIALFRLGFAPRGNLLKETLSKKGFSETLMVKAGLIIERPETRETYDRFRERVMFPIFDTRGKVIAFGGRILGEGEPKYLNSPETPVFHKGRELYAAHFARTSRKSEHPLIVCEGYTDVISLHQGGWTRSVAPLGTALTEEQIQFLWRLDPEPILCFDGDTAGQTAAARAVYRALPLLRPRYSLRFATLPPKEDPASLLQAGRMGHFEKIIQQARPLSDLLWQVELQSTPLKTPEQKAFLQKSLRSRVESITDGTVRKYYGDFFREKLNAYWWQNRPTKASKNTFGSKNAPYDKGIKVSPPGFSGGLTPLDSQGIRCHILIATVINHPKILDEVIENFAEINLSDPLLKKVQEEIISITSTTEALDEFDLKAHLYSRGFKDPLSKILSDDVYLHGRFARPTATTDQALSGWTEIWTLYWDQQHLKDDLKSAQQHLSKNMSLESWQKVQELKKLNRHLSSREDP